MTIRRSRSPPGIGDCSRVLPLPELQRLVHERGLAADHRQLASVRKGEKEGYKKRGSEKRKKKQAARVAAAARYKYRKGGKC